MNTVKHSAIFCVSAAMLLTGLIVVFVYKGLSPNSQQAPLPQFSEIEDTNQRKQAFLNYLAPIIEASNNKILTQRAKLNSLSLPKGISKKDQQFLKTLASEYNLDITSLVEGDIVRELNYRIDTIPVSLTLAQAAKESGWGTSRFSQEANNLFGQWCYTAGCGVVPSQRDSGATHEVKKFISVAEAIDSYLRNINTNNAYKNLRTIRAELRAKDEVTGLALSEGLDKYSQRGHIYVEEIQSLIRYNKLDSFDEPK